MPKIYKKY